MAGITLDTVSLAYRVRHYLVYNQIQWNRFSTLVLGVSQSRLSTLLSKPKPWNTLSKRVQTLYERLQLWMDTRATYGNNPYYIEKNVRQTEGRGNKGKKVEKKKPRSLLEGDDTKEMLKQLKEYTAAAGIVEGQFNESNICHDGLLQDVIEDGEVHDSIVAVETKHDQLMTVQDQAIIDQSNIQSQIASGVLLGTLENQLVESNAVDLKVDRVATNQNPSMTGQFIIQDLATVAQIFDIQPHISSGEGIGVSQVVDEHWSMAVDSSNSEAQDRKMDDTNTIYYLEEEMPICQVFVEENLSEPGTYNLSMIEVNTIEGGD